MEVVVVPQEGQAKSRVVPDEVPKDAKTSSPLHESQVKSLVITDETPDAMPPSGLSTTIELDSGNKIRLDELGLPQELRTVLEELATGKQNLVSCSYLHQQSKLASELAKHLDGKEHEECVKHIDLLGRLMHQRESGQAEIEYTHMPEKVKELLRRWDEDGSGNIDLRELEEAAKAQDSMRNTMKWMKRGILLLIVVLCVLMAMMFAVTFAAVQASKDFHIGGGRGSTLITSTSGEVVQVGSSDFVAARDGVLRARGSSVCAEPDASFAGGCRRLSETENVPVQVALAVQGVDSLTSALPDATFHELLALELVHPGQDNHTLGLTITSWQRVAARSSTCGSVVHLQTTIGRLTLDDRAMSADAQLEGQLKQTGFAFMLAEEGGGGLGRRLQGTDGMLKGFFNLLRGMEQKCMPQPLEPPEDLLKQFRATVHVRTKVPGTPESALSQFFTDSSGNRLPMPGFEVERDNLTGQVLEGYMVWTEEVLSGPGLEVIRSHSAMQPFLKQVRIASGGGAQLSLVVDNSTGFQCTVTQGDEEGQPEVDDKEGGGSSNQDMRMEMMGMVEEDGMLLRHYRLYMMVAQQHLVESRRLQGKLTEEDETSTETMAALIDAGVLPTHMDYFDVDSDPSGLRSPGDPYRIRHDSTMPGSRAFQEKTYLSLEPLEGELTVEESFRLLGVTALASVCVAPPLTNVTAAMASLLTLVPDLTTEGAEPLHLPPTFEPKAERGSAILASYDRLIQAKIDYLRGGSPSEALLLAQSTPAWQAALREEPTLFRPVLEQMVGDDAASSIQDVPRPGSDGNSSRRLDAHARRTAAAQRASQSDNSSRSLAAAGSAPRRRLLSGFEFGQDAWQTLDGGSGWALEVSAGIAGLALEIEFDSTNRITSLVGSASGTVIIWTPPTIELTFFGSISKSGSVIGGELGIEAQISVFGIGLGFGMAIGASMDYRTWKLQELYGRGYLMFGQISAGGTMVLTPKGCGGNYYRRWEVAFSIQFARNGRLRRLSFAYDIPIFSKEIGGPSGC